MSIDALKESYEMSGTSIRSKSEIITYAPNDLMQMGRWSQAGVD